MSTFRRREERAGLEIEQVRQALGVVAVAEPHDVSDDGDLSPFEQDYALIRKAANLVIDEIGEDAATYAAERADLLHGEGDALGAAAWRRIAPVIEELQRKRRKGKPTN